MKIELVLLTPEYKESFISFVEEMLAAKDPFFGQYTKYAAFDMQRVRDDFDAYILKPLADGRQGINLKPGYVPYTTFALVDTDKKEILGRVVVRHRLTPHLTEYAGHIAYAIRPSMRGKGLAKAGLRLALAFCHERLGLQEALVTCDARNEASCRTIVGTLKEYGGRMDTPTQLKDGTVFSESPYHPVNKNHIQLRFWLNTRQRC